MLYTVTALNCPPTLEDAIVLAVQAHHGQVYPTPGGEPFIRHPLRVMLQVEADIERIVAVLHDLVEDTPYTLDDVRRLGYPNEAIEALDRLTRREGEAYEEYIGRIASHPIARRVKLADLTDNLANSRRLEANVENHERIERYERARERLKMLPVAEQQPQPGPVVRHGW